jgi:hypothetical protein
VITDNINKGPPDFHPTRTLYHRSDLLLTASPCSSVPSQIGWICQTVVIFGVPYDPETYFAPSGVGVAFFWIFALLPWCPLSKATMDLAAATNTDKSPGVFQLESVLFPKQ